VPARGPSHGADLEPPAHVVVDCGFSARAAAVQAGDAVVQHMGQAGVSAWWHKGLSCPIWPFPLWVVLAAFVPCSFIFFPSSIAVLGVSEQNPTGKMRLHVSPLRVPSACCCDLPGAQHYFGSSGGRRC